MYPIRDPGRVALEIAEVLTGVRPFRPDPHHHVAREADEEERLVANPQHAYIAPGDERCR